MNCRRVEKLIPLYVEGDLESHSRERISSHLEWCGRCNWLADEFRESQSWLRSSETPAFDEPFFADLKRDVLKRVSSTGARPSLIASLAQHWNRRQMLALCAAVTVVFGMLVMYIYQTRANSALDMHEAVKQTQNNDSDSLPPDLNAVTQQAPGAALEGKHRLTKYRSQAGQGSGGLLSRRTFEPSLFHKTPGNAPEGVSSIPDASLVSGESREMLRIEIQTSDPAIRIIWFASKETESHQNKPATD